MFLEMTSKKGTLELNKVHLKFCGSRRGRFVKHRHTELHGDESLG